jgi:hypothetical protein
MGIIIDLNEYRKKQLAAILADFDREYQAWKKVRIRGFIKDIDFSHGIVLVECCDGNWYEAVWSGMLRADIGDKVELVDDHGQLRIAGY